MNKRRLRPQLPRHRKRTFSTIFCFIDVSRCRKQWKGIRWKSFRFSQRLTIHLIRLAVLCSPQQSRRSPMLLKIVRASNGSVHIITFTYLYIWKKGRHKNINSMASCAIKLIIKYSFFHIHQAAFKVLNEIIGIGIRQSKEENSLKPSSINEWIRSKKKIHKPQSIIKIFHMNERTVDWRSKKKNGCYA